MFDTKIAVLLRDDLAGWQALNVTAFLVSGLPEELRGEPYIDADDVTTVAEFWAGALDRKVVGDAAEGYVFVGEEGTTDKSNGLPSRSVTLPHTCFEPGVRSARSPSNA